MKILKLLVGLTPCIFAQNLQTSMDYTDDSCDVVFINFNSAKNLVPIETKQIDTELTKGCNDKAFLKHTALDYACKNNYTMIQLIEEASIDASNEDCYRAQAAFYQDKPPIKNQVNYNSTNINIEAQGPSFEFNLLGQGVPGGLQSETGLVTEEGDEASLSKMGFGIGFNIYINDYFGLNVFGDLLFASASAPKVKSISMFNQFNFGLNAEISVINTEEYDGLTQIYLLGGTYYTNLSLDNELIDIYEKEFYQATKESAKGIGFNFGFGVRRILTNSITVSIDIIYSNEQPIFPGASKAYNAHSIGLKIGLGFKPSISE